ncbi:MAG: hypothetical protein JO316_17095 [Abitibacteriaceae bacterium]|nr:hypothetical protein [Abditibacteriaceae bacterium]
MTSTHMFPEDVARLKSVASSHGYDITDEQAVAVWTEYSDQFFASWLYLPPADEQLWQIIRSYLTQQ